MVRSLRDERNDGVMSCRFSMSLIFFCFGRFCWVYLLNSKRMRERCLSYGSIKNRWLINHLFMTPSGSSIIRRIAVWSDESIGAIDISRTALNLPQLFKCSFSRRKKFHTKRRNTSSGAKIDVIMSPAIILFSVKTNDSDHINLKAISSMMAK